MIVTITAYKRPALLQRCLESIACAASPGRPFSVLVSLDYHSKEMHERMSDAVADSELTGVQIIRHGARAGVANHPRWVFNTVVRLGHKRIVALEEDTIVAPDVFLFADWALGQREFQFVNLADHKRKQVMFHTATMRVHVDWELRSPYGWAFTAGFWHALEPEWNGKIRLPYGWDWQLSHLCYREGWRSLTPEVARVYNTGREEGTYDTPDNWDRTQKDVRLCDEIPGRYEIVRAGARPDPPDWVKEEMRP
jgi:hypothetical protein